MHAMPAGRRWSWALGALLAVLAATLQPLPGNAVVGTVTIGGPFGGQILGIAVSPHDSQALLAATTQGIFRSGNAGGRWVPASAGLRNLAVHGAVFDVDQPGVAYAATNGGLFRSPDGGASWKALLAAGDLLTHGQAWAIQSVKGAVYASSNAGLIVSRDGGETWSVAYAGTPGGWGVAPSNADVIYLHQEDTPGDPAVLRSGDGGKSWRRTALDFALSVAVDPLDPDRVYVVNGSDVAVTRDGGATWSTTGWEDPATISMNDVQLGGGDTVVVEGGGYAGRYISRSDDGGETWAITRIAGPRHNGVVAVDPHDDRVIYVGGYGDGISRSTDGGVTFVPRDSGLTAQAVRAAAADPANPSRLFAGLGTGGFFGSTDGGTSWTDLTAGLVDRAEPFGGVNVSVVAVAADGVVFAARELEVSAAASVMASQDDGATWVSRTSGLPRHMRPTHLIAHPTDPARLLATFVPDSEEHDVSSNAFITKDGGRSWAEVAQLPGPVSAAHVDPESSLLLLATGAYDGATANNRLYSSNDFGDTWDTLTYPTRLIRVSSLARAPRQGRIYAGGLGNNVGHSDDHGKTWHVSDLDGVPGGHVVRVSVVAVDPVDSTQIFAGTMQHGLWFSRDRGLTWEAVTRGVVGQDVYTLMFPARPASTPMLSASVTAAPAPTPTVVKHRAAFVGMTNRAKSGLARILPRPHNRTRPSILGTRRVGETVRCDRGRWTRATQYRYRWYRSGVLITGAKAATYDIVRRDRGQKLSCRVVAEGPGGKDRALSPKVLVP